MSELRDEYAKMRVEHADRERAGQCDHYNAKTGRCPATAVVVRGRKHRCLAHVPKARG